MSEQMIVAQRDVNQKEKNKYCALTPVHGIQKNGPDEPVCRGGLETECGGQTCGHSEGGSGTSAENGINGYAPSCVRQTGGGTSWHHAGSPAWLF